MRYVEYSVTVTTAGEDGEAVGSGKTPPVNGEIHAVHINYDASAPNTTTVDVDEVGGAGRKILDKAGSNTDVSHYPRLLMQDTAGANLTGEYDRIAIASRPLQVSVAACNALAAAVVVTLVVLEYSSK